MASFNVLDNVDAVWVVPNIVKAVEKKDGYIMTIPLHETNLLVIYLSSTELAGLLSSGDRSFRGVNNSETT